MKELLNDIWRNYRIPLILGVLFAVILTYHFDEIPLIWYIISMVIVLGGWIACIVYGIKKYFKL